MDLLDKVPKLSPDNEFFLLTKGLGYYKQGKYQEALNLLQQAQNIFSAIASELDKDIQSVIGLSRK